MVQDRGEGHTGGRVGWRVIGSGTRSGWVLGRCAGIAVGVWQGCAVELMSRNRALGVIGGSDSRGARCRGGLRYVAPGSVG